MQAYVARVASGVKLARPMKIAIDCGNGVAGAVAPQLFRALGCEVTELFCEVDGTFPNHHPDPAEPKNLRDLIDCVANTDCELGLAFDGDGDRLGVVTKSGQIIWPDRQLVLFARDVLDRNPGATIIYDVKCSRHVGLSVRRRRPADDVEDRPFLVKAKLAETGAPLAGEMSGHIFFKERWYGFDDGLYTGARLLEIVSRHADACAPLEALPQDVSTPELKLEMEEGQPFTLVCALQDHGQFPGASRVVTIDGVRAEYPDGFGLAPVEYHASGGAAFRGAERRGAGPHPSRFPTRTGQTGARSRPAILESAPCHCPTAPPGRPSPQPPAAPRAAESDCESSMLPDCDWTSAPRPNHPNWRSGRRPAAAAGLRGARGCSTGQRQLDRTTPRLAHSAARRRSARDGRARRAVRTRSRAPCATPTPLAAIPACCTWASAAAIGAQG